jgi:hypothetical protein
VPAAPWITSLLSMVLRQKLASPSNVLATSPAAYVMVLPLLSVAGVSCDFTRSGPPTLA